MSRPFKLFLLGCLAQTWRLPEEPLGVPHLEVT